MSDDIDQKYLHNLDTYCKEQIDINIKLPTNI